VILTRLFLGGDEPPCLDAADVDDSGSWTSRTRSCSDPPLPGGLARRSLPGCGRDVTLDSIDARLRAVPAGAGGSIVSFYGQEFDTEGVFYVVDKSWTMVDSGELFIAKREIALSINDLPAGVQFGIVAFDSDISLFPPSGVPARPMPTQGRRDEVRAGSQRRHGSCLIWPRDWPPVRASIEIEKKVLIYVETEAARAGRG